ncbi:hypothetical protein [Terrisporobacter sp.]
MTDKDFRIANITQAEEAVIKKAEAEVKAATGKDFIIIAWEKNN